MAKRRGILGSENRRGTASRKASPAEKAHGRPADLTVCEGCGAVFRDRRWRRGSEAPLSHDVIARAHWGSCPACIQVKRGEYLGRVVVAGRLEPAEATALRRRLRNVAARAEWTQPERRIVSVARTRDGLEILTTSQKLAHRVVHEFKKAFGGRATYRWSDDGSLYAVWRGPRGKGVARTAA